MKRKWINLLLIMVLFSCEMSTIQKSETELEGIEVESDSLETILIDFSEISAVTKNELEKEYWLGDFSFQKIVRKKDGIILELNNEDYAKLLIATEEYLIVSYAVYGTEERTLVY